MHSEFFIKYNTSIRQNKSPYFALYYQYQMTNFSYNRGFQFAIITACYFNEPSLLK